MKFFEMKKIQKNVTFLGKHKKKMISPIRTLCFNDDRQTFTVILPSQYRIFRCEPFGMIFSRECDDISLGCVVATYDGYRFLAITGSPSPPMFNSKCLRIFDHQTGQIVFDNQFEDHILSIRLGNGILVVNMHKKIEIWSTINKKIISKFDIGINVHCPLAISPDSSTIICGGSDDKKITICTISKNDSVSKHNLKVDSNSISLISFSPNKTYFATSAFNGSEIHLWDIKYNHIVSLEKQSSSDIIQTLDFSPDSSSIVCCSKDGLVRVYDLRKQYKGMVKPLPPICSLQIGTVTMPRISWMTDETIGITSLEGDFYKLTLSNGSLEVEQTPFLKRSD